MLRVDVMAITVVNRPIQDEKTKDARRWASFVIWRKPCGTGLPGEFDAGENWRPLNTNGIQLPGIQVER
jgi:hypothetical protein